jgi:hypothetical protein
MPGRPLFPSCLFLARRSLLLSLLVSALTGLRIFRPALALTTLFLSL